MTLLTGLALGLLVMVWFVVSHLKPRDRANCERRSKHAP